MASVLTNEYLYYVQHIQDFYPHIKVSVRLVGNQVTYKVEVNAWYIPGGDDRYEVSISTGNAKLFLNGVEQTTSSFTTSPTNGVVNVVREGTLAGTITGTTTTVRVVLNARGTDWTNSAGFEARSDSPNVAFDKTFTLKRPASITQALLTAAPSTDPWIVMLPSTTTAGSLVHLKNTGTQDIHVWAPTQTIDGLTEGRRIPPKGGMSLFQTGTSAWFIASYFGGAVTNGTATGGTTPTSPIVLANITSGNKTVALPNPATFASSYLCICAYTTGTSTTNSLVITTGGASGYARETDSSSYSWTTASGPSIGLFLVSDGSKWNIVGIYRGTNTTYDSYSVAYPALTSTIGLSSGDRSVDVRPSIAPVADSGVFQIWKTKDIYWTNGAVIGVPSPSLAVNSNYFRWYRNDNIDYSAYIVLNTKVGTGADTIFPLAQYPSDN